MYASSFHNKNPDIVIELLKNGADINAKNRQGQTAWDIINQNQYLKETEAYTEFKKVMDANQNNNNL